MRLGLKFATGDIILIQDADLELNPQEYGILLAPMLAGETDVVYGSRFLKPTHRIPFATRVANRCLTLAHQHPVRRAADRHGNRLQGVPPRGHSTAIRLRCVGFDFEPELTAKLLRAGRRIVEVPITYNPRRSDEGKKIRWTDGVDAVYVLLEMPVQPLEAPVDVRHLR